MTTQRDVDRHHAVALLADEDYPGAQQYLAGGWESLTEQQRQRAADLFAQRYGRPMA